MQTLAGGGTGRNGGTRWGRWLGLVTAVWVQYISGNNYTFSNYSHSIKTLMGLTQQQLKTASPSPRKRRAVAEAAQLCALPNTVAQFFRRPVLPRWPPAAPSVVAASQDRKDQSATSQVENGARKRHRC
uniref:Nodulin-like domain-containing protein n=1 Tax=Oryza rufipogon TaxID=4529 RepID=A0A0E0Q6S1_ORYRU